MSETLGDSQAWLVLCFGDERQYAGNVGYEDHPEKSYDYDSLVPYHKQVKVGDLVVLQSRAKVLGYARIEAIDSVPGKRPLMRCPRPGCGTTGIKRRKHREPAYRCNHGHEFSVPSQEVVACTRYTARYAGTFRSERSTVSPQSLRSAWVSRSDQTAMRPLSLPRLMEVVPPGTRGTLKDLMAFVPPLGPDDAADAAEHSPPDPGFSPSDEDLRETVNRQIRARRGQAQFRQKLRRRHGDICQVTGCKLVSLLEAAHIAPYRGARDNHVDNGLLLRSDIHTLFDLDLLGVEPESLTIRLHPSVAYDGYEALAGARLRCRSGRPSKAALSVRWARFSERLAGGA